MPEEMKINEYYAVACDGCGDGCGADSLLGEVRRSFFTGGGKTVHGSVSSMVDGHAVRTKYRIGTKCFRWKSTCGKLTLEEVFSVKNGFYRLVAHGFSGRLFSAQTYDRAMHWLQTAFYDGDAACPSLIIRRSENCMVKLRRTPEGTWERTLLLPCPWEPATAAQSRINAKAGVPGVVAQTDAGTACFCTAEERRLRLKLRAELREDPAMLRPAWAAVPYEKLEFKVIANDGTAANAPEGKNAGGKAAEKAAPVQVKAESRKGRYYVAAKGLSGGVKGAFGKGGGKAAAGAEDAGQPAGLIPAKRIVATSIGSYIYFGRLLNGMREGYGRTQAPDGRTAYEGGYSAGKRDGFGVYYYKSGKICYVGGWKQDLRHGFGVAFGAKDGSLFVGHWKGGCATGEGTEFSAGGSLLYTGGWKDGLRHGRGTEYSGGRIVRSGFWENGKFLGVSGGGGSAAEK